MTKRKLKQERQNIRADAKSNFHMKELENRIMRAHKTGYRAERRLLLTALRDEYPEVTNSLVRPLAVYIPFQPSVYVRKPPREVPAGSL